MKHSQRTGQGALRNELVVTEAAENWKATAAPSSLNFSQEEKNGNVSPRSYLSNKHVARLIDIILEL